MPLFFPLEQAVISLLKRINAQEECKSKKKLLTLLRQSGRNLIGQEKRLLSFEVRRNRQFNPQDPRRKDLRSSVLSSATMALKCAIRIKTDREGIYSYLFYMGLKRLAMLSGL